MESVCHVYALSCTVPPPWAVATFLAPSGHSSLAHTVVRRFTIKFAPVLLAKV